MGKTAIVEALAQRIANNDVPITLLGKELVAVDMGSVVAGLLCTVGNLSEQRKRCWRSLKAYPNIILLDEIHTPMGSGNARGA